MTAAPPRVCIIRGTLEWPSAHGGFGIVLATDRLTDQGILQQTDLGGGPWVAITPPPMANVIGLVILLTGMTATGLNRPAISQPKAPAEAVTPPGYQQPKLQRRTRAPTSRSANTAPRTRSTKTVEAS